MFRKSSIPLIVAVLLFCMFATVPASAEEILVQNCTTEFPDRFLCSTDRTGVLSYVPKEGSRVRVGEVVVQLRDEVPRAELAVAQERASSDAAIQSAIKEAESIELELTAAREANALARTAVSAYPPTHINRLELQLAAARYRVEQARHEKRIAEKSLDQAQALVDLYSIPTKLSGIVTNVTKHLGEGVQQAEPILEIVNTETIRVKGYVTLADSFRINVGMPVKVYFQLPGASRRGQPDAFDMENAYTGTLGYIDVIADPVRNEVVVWAEVPNETGRLREGMWATMNVIATDPAQNPGPGLESRNNDLPPVAAPQKMDVNVLPPMEETPRTFSPTDTLPRF